MSVMLRGHETLLANGKQDHEYSSVATGREREQGREQLRNRKLPSSLPGPCGHHLLSLQQICEVRIIVAVSADGEPEALEK